jgi:hypothetical protein
MPKVGDQEKKKKKVKTKDEPMPKPHVGGKDPNTLSAAASEETQESQRKK